ncbi:hypothetical protein BFW38_09290 [Terasakiispira papahanaumokuakeensis]|uniref:Uncharacterized protein n=1 Tax=Terasakiispira papahanaumokuakeensis TaxID=197479 RepID=A0A1E2VA52_9GAMM|nr:hypothetical protein [Terasakiispira papahanaumokuakeensis]ODC03706.1 hypothetical protein BFW38_09290 [Terasakiispira papahanaumokuakeensis]
MSAENYVRLLEMVDGLRTQFRTPGGIVMLSGCKKGDMLALRFSAKPEGQVCHAHIEVTPTQLGALRIERLIGTSPLTEDDLPNPMSGQGVSSFLVNSLIATLQPVIDPDVVLGGRLGKPRRVDLEPLAARRNFWRRFGFDVEEGLSGRERVGAPIGQLYEVPTPLFNSASRPGLDLLHAHLMQGAS